MIGLIIGIIGSLAATLMGHGIAHWWGGYSKRQQLNRVWDQEVERKARLLLDSPVARMHSLAVLVWNAVWGAGLAIIVAITLCTAVLFPTPSLTAIEAVPKWLFIAAAPFLVYVITQLVRETYTRYTIIARAADISQGRGPVTGDLSSDQARAASSQSSTPG